MRAKQKPSGPHALLLARLDAVGSGNQPNRFIRSNMTEIDLAIRKHNRHPRADANGDDARRVGARALERPALEGFKVRGLPPCRGASGIDKCAEVSALAQHQREFGTLRLPFGPEAWGVHPFAEEGAAVGGACLVDTAALAAHAMRAPHARQLVEL